MAYRPFNSSQLFALLDEFPRRYTYRELQEVLMAARHNDPTLAKVMSYSMHGKICPEEAMTFATLILVADNARLRGRIAELQNARATGPAVPSAG